LTYDILFKKYSECEKELNLRESENLKKLTLNKIDVCFLIDGTFSMENYIRKIRNNI
jgi:hypothetical protein